MRRTRKTFFAGEEGAAFIHKTAAADSCLTMDGVAPVCLREVLEHPTGLSPMAPSGVHPPGCFLGRCEAHPTGLTSNGPSGVHPPGSLD